MKLYYSDTCYDFQDATHRLLEYLTDGEYKNINEYDGSDAFLIVSNLCNADEYLKLFTKYKNYRLGFILDYTKEGHTNTYHTLDFLSAAKKSEMHIDRFIVMYNNMTNFGKGISKYEIDGFLLNELSFPFWFYEYCINPPLKIYTKNYVKYDFTCFCKMMRKHKMDTLSYIEKLGLNVFATSGRIDKHEPIKTFSTSITTNVDDIVPYDNVDLPKEMYLSGKVSILTETNYDNTRFIKGNRFTDVCHPTEKIFRCFGLKQPFTVVGDKFILKNLKKLGFETFESIIDESYDYADDDIRYKKAVDSAVELLKHYDSDELNAILDRNFDKVCDVDYIKSVFNKNFIEILNKIQLFNNKNLV